MAWARVAFLEGFPKSDNSSNSSKEVERGFPLRSTPLYLAEYSPAMAAFRTVRSVTRYSECLIHSHNEDFHRGAGICPRLDR